ncbi:MAG: CHAT domain-containing protein [Caulobacter sp.]
MFSERAARGLLLSDERQGLLEDYFGAEQYEELRRLAEEAELRSVRGAGRKVLIIPGILGSHLGFERPVLDDVIWLDPVDIALGKLLQLRLEPGTKVRALGVVLFAYLSLKLRLEIAGYDAEFYPYDWRRSLTDLGRGLASKLAGYGETHIVAHSMGGLVSRAALAHPVPNLRRIIMLGTPNYGSFAPVEAFRGTIGAAVKLSKLGGYKMPELVDMFTGFPGLMQMAPSALPGQDFFQLDAWPQGTALTQEALTRAGAVIRGLPAAPGPGQEIILVAGVNRPTKVAARIVGSEFEYTVNNEGDGTVPLAFARIASAAKTYFVEEEHGKLPGNAAIQRALPDLLDTGKTSKLPETYELRRGASETRLTETTIRSLAGSLEQIPQSAREQREIVREFVAPADPSDLAPSLKSAVVEAGAGPVASYERSSGPIIMRRDRQRRLEITLALGDIIEADAACYVMGVFRHVRVGGAALAIDGLMGGAVQDMVSRRMISGDVGVVNILPKGRHPLRADNVAFVGLGGFDTFNEDVYEAVGENLIRTFVATRVDDFAMVPFGGATSRLTPQALRRLIKGFLRALAEADGARRFRGVTICEKDPEQFRLIQETLYRLAQEPTFDDIEVVLNAVELPAPSLTPTRGSSGGAAQPTYVLIRQDSDQTDEPTFTTSVLTPGAKAAIVRGRVAAPRATLDQFLARLDSIDGERLDNMGVQLGKLVLSEPVRQVLAQNLQSPMVLVHDAGASRIPWEILQVGGAFPALGGGLSHRFEAENLSIAKWLTGRQAAAGLNVLLIVNPTKDLAGAEREGDRIKAILGDLGGAVKLTVIEGDEARYDRILKCLRSGEFDVVHYAGHAFFDPVEPSRSGILCAERHVLSGADLAGISNLPSLMFFNACEAARVRKLEGDPPPPRNEQIRRNVGFAEALLRGGVKNYVGTYWPVGDDAAKTFATTFYPELLAGREIGEALKKARLAVRGGKNGAAGSNDWADYIHYGDPGFVLKFQSQAGG